MPDTPAPLSLTGLLNAAPFWQPEYLTAPSAWIEHGPFMFWLISTLKPKQFVELGTHYGYSYFCACQAVQRLQLATRCFAVDSWEGDSHASHYGEEVFKAVSQHNRQYAKFSTLVRQRFESAVDLFADQSIDLLHIDGLHFYESVAHDFEIWLPKLSAWGVVLFHDTAVHERDFGVWKFFAELKEKYPNFEFYHGNGLGLIVPDEVPEFLKPLLSASETDKKAFCDVFAGLGQALMEKRHLLQAEDAEVEKDEIEPSVVLEAQQLLPQLDKFPDKLRRSLFWPEKIWRRLRYQVATKKFKIHLLRRSAFFDAEWYYKNYPDVAVAQMDPAQHYFYYGAREGRNPGPLFSTANYLARHPDAAQSGVNPLLHCAGYQKLISLRSNLSYSDTLNEADVLAIRRHLASLVRKPLISIVMPVYNPPETLLREAIASVQAQLYTDWELCIADDASSKAYVKHILTEASAGDSRIRVIYREKNGNISAASNSALALAHGEFVALLDHDDLLHITALYEVAVKISQHPDADVIYSDEDLIDEKGRRSQPYFKPDFNPELILGQNMVSHLGVYRRSLLEQIGGFREGFEGSQDYDLFLRAWSASSARRIHHIPAVLYHWRKGSAAPSFSEQQLDRCTDAARRAIQDFLDREGEEAQVVPAPALADYSRVCRKIPEPHPLVSVIIPTRDQASLLRNCLNGLFQQTNYKNIEVLIIDHESHEAETSKLFAEFKKDERVRILPYRGVFNFSAMNNMAAREARGSILLLLNNDIAILEPKWLHELVSHAVRPEVGAVGAKLLYPNSRVQHAGVVIGLGGVAGHYLCGIKDTDYGYFAQAILSRSSSAVTAACLAVRKDIYWEVGGLEERLKVAFNDIDFCLKIQACGYRNVWTPFAKLLHYESISRGPDSSPEKIRRINSEIAFMREKWQELIANDPFYNPNLSLNTPNAEIAHPSRRIKPWGPYL